MIKEEEAKSFLVNGKLPEKVVEIKPNYENPGWIKRRNHRAFFLMEGTSKQYGAPLTRSGQIANVLTKEEKALLEKELNMEENALSVYKKDNNFWHDFRIRLTKDALKLNLSDPMDYIRFKIALSQKDNIAPSIKNIRDKATYKFYIEDKDEVNEVLSQVSDLNAKVWSKYGTLSTDRQKMLDVLYVYAVSFKNQYARFRNIDPESKMELLQSELSKVVEKDMNLFLEVVNDPLFDIKLVLSKAINKGLVNRVGEAYYLKGDPNPFAKDFQAACKYLKDDANQEFVETLKERIKVNE